MKKHILLGLFLIISLISAGTVFAQSGARGGGSLSRKQSTSALRITSNVRGADVFINGERVGRIPFSITLNNSTYKVRVSAPGHSTFEETITLSRDTTVNAFLKSMGHDVRVLSNVNGARVFINGEFRGNAPVNTELPPGRYSLRLTAPGYQDYETTISVNRPETFRAFLQPDSRTLTVESNIRGAEVFINGERRGVTPLRTELPMGRYSIRVSAPNHIDYNSTMDLNSDATLNAYLQPIAATVSVTIPQIYLDRYQKDPDRQIQIHVDGQLQGGNVFQVKPGSHTIRITSGGFSFEQSFVFHSGQTYSVEFFADIRLK